MANEEYLSISTLNERAEQTIDGDNQSTSDSGNLLDTNAIELQGDFNDSMSQDSLTNDDRNKFERPSSTTTNSKFSSKMSTIKSTSNGTATLRSFALDQHIKLVKQKKEEAEILRLQKFQEQLRKKEQKWQQQQLERVKKWLQLRNRDTDHRTQVEERRRKREEEAKAKIEELIRREKEREQRVQHNRTTKPDNLMTMSIDIGTNRRATSASRLRSNQPDRRFRNDSSDDNSNVRDEPERRLVNTDRQHLNETIRRLAKPKNLAMSQSIHVNTLTTKTLPLSRSSHQLRMTTSTINRRQPTSRPATVPTSICSPSDQSKVPLVSKKPTTRSKATNARSLMTNSHSSSSISSVVKRSSQVNSPLKSTSINENELIHQTKSDDERDQTLNDEQDYQRRLNEKIREAQQRLELERQREIERQQQIEHEEYEREQEQIRFVNEQQRIEQERLQQAIDECQRQNQLKQDEQIRQQQQREQLERQQAEENQRLNLQREEKLRQQEQERIERKKRLDLIMKRTRQISPTSKQDAIQTDMNGHENNHINDELSPKSSISHSISDNRFPTSTSTEHFLLTESVAMPAATDLPKFKSPLIQSLLNKARSTRSTDNLIQTNLTSSQIRNETIHTETSRTKSNELSQENGHNRACTIETTAASFQ